MAGIGVGLSSDDFWGYIATLNLRGRKQEAVVAPLVTALAKGSRVEIAGFEWTLSVKLFALDGRSRASHAGATIWFGEPDDLSGDRFLYARCAVVATGRTAYETVLQDPSAMPPDVGLEALLYVAGQAWERKTGQADVVLSMVSAETFANSRGWPDPAAS